MHKCKLLWDSRNITDGIGEDHSKDEQKLGKLNILTTADAKRAKLAQFWILATPMLCCIEPPNGFTSRRREFNVAKQIERHVVAAASIRPPDVAALVVLSKLALQYLTRQKRGTLSFITSRTLYMPARLGASCGVNKARA